MGRLTCLFSFNVLSATNRWVITANPRRYPRVIRSPSQRCRLSFIRYVMIPDSVHARSKLAELTPKYPPSRVAVSTALSRRIQRPTPQQRPGVSIYHPWIQKNIKHPAETSWAQKRSPFGTVEGLRLFETYSDVGPYICRHSHLVRRLAE